MKNTVLVELKNENALNLLYDLEKMDILHVVKEPVTLKLENTTVVDVTLANEMTPKIKHSDKFRGILTKEQGESLRAHVKKCREEWERNIF